MCRHEPIQNRASVYDKSLTTGCSTLVMVLGFPDCHMREHDARLSTTVRITAVRVYGRKQRGDACLSTPDVENRGDLERGRGGGCRVSRGDEMQ